MCCEILLETMTLNKQSDVTYICIIKLIDF